MLDVKCQVDGLNPYGRVGGVHLRLQAIVFPVLMSGTSLSQGHYLHLEPEVSTIYEDCTVIPNGETVRRAKKGDPSIMPFSGKRAVCVLVYKPIEHPKSVVYAFILGETRKQDVYHRVGIATFNPKVLAEKQTMTRSKTEIWIE